MSAVDERDTLDWQAWHDGYEQPDSPLSRRLALVREQIAAALERGPESGTIRVISICAGQGHDVIGVLAGHPLRERVRARLVELDEHNVDRARAAAALAGVEGLVECVVGDASLSDAYAGAVPAEVLVVAGVLGNVSLAHVERAISHLPELCAPAATVVWTRHRHPPDGVPHVRAAFARAGFEQLAFADAPPFGVGAHRLAVAPRPFRPGVRLFEFIGHEALWPHLRERERAALGALFRPDCTLAELVEAMRALPLGRPAQDTPQEMLREGRGMPAAKHLFLWQVIAARFPQTEPELVHRTYRLDGELARALFGQTVADAIPEAEGVTLVHRYLRLTLGGRCVALDASLAGAPWDGRSELAPVCGPGEDVAVPAGADPEAELRRLEHEHGEPPAQLTAALARLNAPPGAVQ